MQLKNGMIRRVWRGLLAFALSLTLALPAACDHKKQQTPAGEEYPVTAGGVTLEKAPQRIVCLAPSHYAALDAMGATSAVVGVGSGADAGEDTPRVGSAALPDVQAIVALSPDLVLTSGALDPADAQSLALQEIPVAVIPAAARYDGLEAYYSQIAQLVSGRKTGEANAARTAAGIREKAQAVADKVKGQPRVRACLLLGSQTAAGTETFAGDLLELAGGENAAGKLEAYQFSNEALAAAAPEVIFCPSTLLSTITSGSLFAGIPAVQNGRVYALEPYLLETPGDELDKAVQAMASRLYPDLFPAEEPGGASSDTGSAAAE